MPTFLLRCETARVPFRWIFFPPSCLLINNAAHRRRDGLLLGRKYLFFVPYDGPSRRGGVMGLFHLVPRCYEMDGPSFLLPVATFPRAIFIPLLTRAVARSCLSVDFHCPLFLYANCCSPRSLADLYVGQCFNLNGP